MAPMAKIPILNNIHNHLFRRMPPALVVPGEEDSSQQAQDDATADGLPSDSGDNLPVEETLLDSQPSIFPDDGLILLMPMENHPLLNFLKPPSLLTGTNDTGLLNTADGFLLARPELILCFCFRQSCSYCTSVSTYFSGAKVSLKEQPKDIIYPVSFPIRMGML